MLAGFSHDSFVAHAVGLQPPMQWLVMDPHARTAAATQHASLQQRAAVARHATAQARREATCIVHERSLVALVLGPRDVAFMCIWNEYLPVRLLHTQLHSLELGVVGSAGTPIGKRTCVSRVVQNLQHARVIDCAPQHVTLADAATNAPGEEDLLPAQAAYYRARGTCLAKRVKQQSHRVLDLPVWIEHRTTIGRIGQPDGQRHFEFAAPCLVENATLQARLEDVQLGLAHRAFQAEQQAVVEVCGVVDAILVENKRVR
ncbi:hypothetical protein LMG28727_07718 [Paraburkholderia kirstenboschensis]|nr:hypothetical protein LMG28727_07718 [Paraburkholderia kirstenboschensis]